METLMKVDPAVVTKLREARAWPQDHLAEVAGLSLRTIQRVEADGTASAETKMAIASAFGVAPEDLTSKPPSERSVSLCASPGVALGVAFGFAGIAIGAISACIGVASGSNTAFEAGLAYGLIGLGSGFGCALIGTVSNRYWHPRRVDA